LDLEIALSDASAKVQPHGLLQPGRRCVETSGDVIENGFMPSGKICRALSSINYCRTTPYVIGRLFLTASDNPDVGSSNAISTS
jgi:hypothetical protein